MSEVTYLLRSETGNAVISAAAQHLVNAIKASEQKLGKRVPSVEIDFSLGEGDLKEKFRLSFSRQPSDEVPLTEGGTRASGGVQSGGASASPGAVPAAPIRRGTKRAKK